MRHLPLFLFILVGLMVCDLVAADSAGDKPSVPGQLQILQQENAKLKEVVASKDKELAEIKNRLTSAEAEAKRLADQNNKELLALKGKLTQAEAEAKRLGEKNKNLDEQLRVLQNTVRSLKDQIARLEKEKTEAANNLSQVRDSHGTLTRDLESKVRRYKDKAEHYKRGYIAVSIVLYSLVALELLLGILFLVLRLFKNKRKEQSVASCPSQTISEKKSPEAHVSKVVEKNEKDLRCPMCGWRYNPGEKVCKNCRTQF